MPYKSIVARRKYWKKWHDEHKDDYNAKVRARYHSPERHDKARAWRSNYDKENRRAYRAEVIAIFGGKCKFCGEDDSDMLQVDHVKGGGLKELRKTKGNRNHFRRVLAHVKRGGKRYQLLCANCNWKKRRTNNEVRNGRFHK